jgi:hypothetical protein
MPSGFTGFLPGWGQLGKFPEKRDLLNEEM